MNIILFGPPGAGKGTLSSKLNQFGFFAISTGDILRSEVADKTELGLQIAEIMNRGELVNDKLMIDLIVKQVKGEKNYLLDGFPRNISQALELNKFFKVDKVINLVVEKEILLKRILGRRICQNCKANYNIYFKMPKKEGQCDSCEEKLITRKDDNEESLSIRLEKYYEKSSEVVDYYQNQEKLLKIDASKNPDEIFNEVKKSLHL